MLHILAFLLQIDCIVHLIFKSYSTAPLHYMLLSFIEQTPKDVWRLAFHEPFYFLSVFALPAEYQSSSLCLLNKFSIHFRFEHSPRWSATRLTPTTEKVEGQSFSRSFSCVCVRIRCTLVAYTVCNFVVDRRIRREGDDEGRSGLWGFGGCVRRGIWFFERSLGAYMVKGWMI